MGLGKLIYQVFFKPTLSFRYHISHFGFSGWLRMRRGEVMMKKKAGMLPPIVLGTDRLLEVNYLTGARYWHQTLYCAYTLARHLDGRLGIKLYSDGSLTAAHTGTIQKVLPGVEIISEAEVVRHLDAVLPQAEFPALRYLREWHPFFRRLIDIHTSASWALHLDSDMLFFGRPAEILEAYRDQQAVFMKEQLSTSYFVDREEVLRDHHGIHCTGRVNGGIIAYDNSRVDYADLEAKAKILLERYPAAGPAQVEQTLMSYILHRQAARALDEKAYTIFYDEKPDFSASQVVRHYIFKAKMPYLTTEWKALHL